MARKPIVGKNELLIGLGFAAQYLIQNHPAVRRFKEAAAKHVPGWLDGDATTLEFLNSMKKDLKKPRSRKGIRRVKRSLGPKPPKG